MSSGSARDKILQEQQSVPEPDHFHEIQALLLLNPTDHSVNSHQPTDRQTKEPTDEPASCGDSLTRNRASLQIVYIRENSLFPLIVRVSKAFLFSVFLISRLHLEYRIVDVELLFRRLRFDCVGLF